MEKPMRTSGPGPVVRYSVAQSFLKGEDVVLVEPRLQFPPADLLIQDERGLRSCLTRSSPFDSVTSADRLSPVKKDSGSEEASTGFVGKQKENGVPNGASRSPASEETATYGLFCVFDGHNGVAAAQHIRETLCEVLEPLLPPGRPPAEDSGAEYVAWREQLQQALVCALDEVQATFACTGHTAGTTVTIIIQCGWLLTIAGLGDSRAVLDTGADIVQLSVDHRVATHRQERHRLEGTGALVAPIDVSGSGPASGPTAQGWGPLRVWPGGLCLSRAVGDFDVGAIVLAIPHIMQVRVPDTGGRILVASDGVWDAFEKMVRVCRMVRRWPVEEAPEKLITAIQRAHGGLKDDTSVIVLDLLPLDKDFPSIAGVNSKSKATSGFMCCAAPSATKDDDDLVLLGKAQIMADIDYAEVVGLSSEPSYVPSWYNEDLGTELRHSQEAAVDAWKEACSMRRSGKEPSRVDLASYFASHLNGDAEKASLAAEDDAAADHEAGPPQKAVPAVYSGMVPSKERSKAQATRHISFAPAEENAAADLGKPIPAAFGGRPQPSPRRPPPDVMDYTVKAGMRPTHAPSGTPDYSVKAGKMTSQVAAALAAARTADRSQRGPPAAAAGDASVRFGQAHFATTQEGFARQFGPYAGSLITGDDSSHGSEDAANDSVSQHFPAAVASSEESYARKFGHYSHDSRMRVENGGDRRVSERVEDLVPTPGPSGAQDLSCASDRAIDASTSSLPSERFSSGRLSAIQEGRAMSRASVDIGGEGRVKGGAAAASELFPGRSNGRASSENTDANVTAKPSKPQQ
ncbi:probable protein phosphatase 2C 5 at N-terminal half [Coccomyxa sp. Obi]|nr:probable protein phosphatase 2C 5 at N-terminal half [Coccomyxa sp. Obi]